MISRPPPSMRTIGNFDETHARVVLVRHGEPVAATLGLVGGPRGDTGLTEAGRAQVRCLEERLSTSREFGEIAALYSSTLPRAIETAELLAPAFGGIEVQQRHELREHDPGELDAMTWADRAGSRSRPSTPARAPRSSRWATPTTARPSSSRATAASWPRPWGSCSASR